MALPDYTTQDASTYKANIDDTVRFKGAMVYLDSSQTLNDSVTLQIPFDQEFYDTNSIHDNATDNTRLTVPAGFTKVRLTGQVYMTAATAAGFFSANIKQSGSISKIVAQSQAGNEGVVQVHNLDSGVRECEADDYFELQAAQTSGSAESVGGDAAGQNTWFMMELIE